MKWIGAIFLVIALSVAGVWFKYSTFINSTAGTSHTEVPFEVKQGESFSSISKRLVDLRLISDELSFNVWAKVTKQRSRIKAGEYILTQTMSPIQIMNIIASGKSITKPFTVSEGLNIYEIAILFERAGYGSKAEFLKTCFDQDLLQQLLGERVYSCEGYMFPETYQLERKTSARELVRLMTAQFLQKWQQSAVELQIEGWTRNQIVTLASIIEKETGAPEERALISSVFHNRLIKNMRLQTDPTVLYGVLDLTKVYKENITRSDLDTPTKFNTYTNSGLPPSPISNPGIEALKAAVHPESSGYLFFVSKNDGTHIFTEKYEDHRKAVGKFQLDNKARQGKSWRDLKAKKNSQ